VLKQQVWHLARETSPPGPRQNGPLELLQEQSGPQNQIAFVGEAGNACLGDKSCERIKRILIKSGHWHNCLDGGESAQLRPETDFAL
jgi:hypothetical protein